MADTLTTSIPLRHPFPASNSTPNVGILIGSTNISSYSTSKVAYTPITGVFGTGYAPTVVCDGVSSGGYAMRWDPSVSAFRAYLQTGTAAVLTEAGAAANIGSFNWIATGQLRG